jgi:flagellar protein FliS
MTTYAQKNNDYLATEVMTASPQRLKLMLIDAAIRYIHRAKQLIGEGDNVEGSESLIRAQHVVGELLSGLDPSQTTELSRKIAAIYMFVYRSLIDSALTHDLTKADEALRVLHEERETWQQVCLQLADAAPADNAAEVSTPAAAAAPIMPMLDTSDVPSGGFSIQA